MQGSIPVDVLLYKIVLFTVQVKNFGRSGRTKYTHLVDQDTTDFESSWAQPSQAAINFQNKFGGGLKQVFVKPTAKKRKIE